MWKNDRQCKINRILPESQKIDKTLQRPFALIIILIQIGIFKQFISIQSLQMRDCTCNYFAIATLLINANYHSYYVIFSNENIVENLNVITSMRLLSGVKFDTYRYHCTFHIAGCLHKMSDENAIYRIHFRHIFLVLKHISKEFGCLWAIFNSNDYRSAMDTISYLILTLYIQWGFLTKKSYSARLVHKSDVIEDFVISILRWHRCRKLKFILKNIS